MSAYAFRLMTADDLPLVRRWLGIPDVRLWWGDPDAQTADLAEGLRDPVMAMWIVAHEGRPFAYVQDYDPLAWSLPLLAGVPAGARGLDQFIGEPDMLNRGHGTAFLQAHVERLFAQGTPAATVDPDPGNLRAVRAYEKAGFSVLRETVGYEGKTVLLMMRRAARVGGGRRGSGAREPPSKPPVEAIG